MTRPSRIPTSPARCPAIRCIPSLAAPFLAVLSLFGASLIALSVTGPSVAAQSSSARLVPVRSEPATGSAAVPAGVAAAAQAQGGAAAAGQDAPKPDSPRLVAFKKVAFDRRPSTILQAWAAPEPTAPDEDPELALPEVPAIVAEADAVAAAKQAAAQQAEGGRGSGDSSSDPSAGDGSGDPVSGDPASGDAVTGDAAAGPDGDPAGQRQPVEGAGAETSPATPAGSEGAAQQAAAAAVAKARAEYTAAKAVVEAKRQAREFEILQRDVTLGRWERVAAFLTSFPAEDEQRAAYEHLLTALARTPPPPQQYRNIPAQFQEHNRFDLDDLLGLAGAAPGTIEKPKVALLAPMAQRALADGHAFEALMRRLEEETARPEDERVVDRRRAALLLAAIGKEAEIGGFLPAIDEAAAADPVDREALNLLARHFEARFASEKQTVHLEQAWLATQSALVAGEIGDDEKEEALRRAVSLAPRIREELGSAWLAESFTSRPDRGMEIIATIGAQASKGQVERARDADFRKQTLELQKTAVEALLDRAPERAQAWRGALNLLAFAWLREALHSYDTSEATSMGPAMRRDAFGNIFYVNYGYNQVNRSPVAPLDPGDLQALKPSGRWAELLDASMRPRYAATVAKLYLKVHEEEAAFPFIEQLAATHPEQAEELAREFLEVWIRNHDPNSQRNRTNVYMFSYGFNQRANGIPLTRSKQERNLEDLAAWIEKLRALPIGELDEQLLVRAFTASHSAAEVYRLQTIEKVFGPLGELAPKTIAALAQRMRASLVSTWRRPDVQEAAKTRRRQQDIQREVQRGYGVAMSVVTSALREHPQHWGLQAALAALIHDQNNYQKEIAGTSEFSSRRNQALELFAHAAAQYTGTVADLPVDEETDEAFTLWFTAALGACDLAAVDERTTLAGAEPAKIRAALEAIPGEAGARHRAMFANSLFTRLSAVKPETKFRYLKAGFEVVGDHPQAHEARKVYEYYRDLVTEIRLVADVRGPTDVGTEPFGVRIDLVHTREIERESGGFARYLQNQNNVAGYSYNYGRPTENYRDKFEEGVRAALAEHFEVKSVTFNSEKVHSKDTEEYGWRRTPYAYLLLQARGPEVDRIPQLKIDLDFLDTSGYVVLPVESSVVAIDASRSAAAPPPLEDLEITQILDERRADDGLLELEIRAQARGLVPALDRIVDLQPADFIIDGVEDQGVAVTRFDEDQERIVSERLWTVAMRARDGLAEQPRTFRFAAARDDTARTLFQRYDDADLVTASQEVELLARYGDAGTTWWPWVLGGLAVLLVAGIGFVSWRRRPREAGSTGLQVPAQVNAFTVLGLLRQIEASNGFDDQVRGELRGAIGAIEAHYFRESGGEAPDLGRIAEEWVARAS